MIDEGHPEAEKFDRDLSLLTEKKELMKKKETFQFKRDMEDEISWADEKMAQAGSKELGNTLGEVALLLKKVQMLQAEIANHEPRISSVMETGQKMIDEG